MRRGSSEHDHGREEVEMKDTPIQDAIIGHTVIWLLIDEDNKIKKMKLSNGTIIDWHTGGGVHIFKPFSEGVDRPS